SPLRREDTLERFDAFDQAGAGAAPVAVGVDGVDLAGADGAEGTPVGEAVQGGDGVGGHSAVVAAGGDGAEVGGGCGDFGPGAAGGRRARAPLPRGGPSGRGGIGPCPAPKGRRGGGGPGHPRTGPAGFGSIRSPRWRSASSRCRRSTSRSWPRPGTPSSFAT